MTIQNISASQIDDIKNLIKKMSEAYRDGRNAMEVARSLSRGDTTFSNSTSATLIAYDLQSGSYVKAVTSAPEDYKKWCIQLAEIIRPYVGPRCTILEVGCGEATTLSGVVQNLSPLVDAAFGFDLSWSRIKTAQNWLKEKHNLANLFVGDLFSIPLADNSIDVVYSSHSLEPNGGREKEAIKECLRVARDKVILIEPIYELAPPEAQERMRHHGYVRDLKKISEEMGVNVLRYELLPFGDNPLNPSGVIVLKKSGSNEFESNSCEKFQCPITCSPLKNLGDYYFADEVGLAYPVLQGVPLLRPEHVVVASLLGNGSGK